MSGEETLAYNAAAMREALLKAIVLLMFCDWPYDAPMKDIAKVIDEIEKAASVPPRNCDRYSHDEALAIWAAEKENGENGCFDEWLYQNATEQKGEPDGSK